MYRISKELRALAEEELHKTKKEWLESNTISRSNICWGQVLTLEGQKPVRIFAECHRWVSDAFYKICGDRWGSPSDKGSRFLVLNCTPKHQKVVTCSEKSLDALILWIARDSPFSEYVVNRKDTDSLLKGGVILACGHSGLTPSEAMWVCKVIRYACEADKALDVWLGLVSRGINPLFALAVCTFVKTVQGATFGFSPRNVHSSVFDDYFDPAFLLGGVPNKSAENTQEVFCGGATDNLRLTLENFCKPSPVSDGWGGFVPSQGDVAKKEFYEKVLAWQNELEEGLKQ